MDIEMQHKAKVVHRSTGGWCKSYGGVGGGWACILRSGQHRKSLSGATPSKSEIRMELMAAVSGLKQIKFPCFVEWKTGCSCLFECASRLLRPKPTDSFVASVRSGKAKNADLWKDFTALSSTHNITLEWIPARTNHLDSRVARASARSLAFHCR
jgi:ribonuclease HI